jgi:hypothetical protein
LTLFLLDAREPYVPLSEDQDVPTRENQIQRGDKDQRPTYYVSSGDLSTVKPPNVRNLRLSNNYWKPPDVRNLRLSNNYWKSEMASTRKNYAMERRILE